MRRLVFAIALCVLIGGWGFAAAQGQPGTATPGAAACASPVASPMASPAASTPDASAAAVMGSPEASPCASSAGSVIKVTASAYQFTPNAFNLKVGQAVTFVVTSADIYHTFTVKQSENAAGNLFSLEIQPGKTATFTFTPTQPGDLFLYCIPHRALGMVGAIHVSA